MSCKCGAAAEFAGGHMMNCEYHPYYEELHPAPAPSPEPRRAGGCTSETCICRHDPAPSPQAQEKPWEKCDHPLMYRKGWSDTAIKGENTFCTVCGFFPLPYQDAPAPVKAQEKPRTVRTVKVPGPPKMGKLDCCDWCFRSGPPNSCGDLSCECHPAPVKATAPLIGYELSLAEPRRAEEKCGECGHRKHTGICLHGYDSAIDSNPASDGCRCPAPAPSPEPQGNHNTHSCSDLGCTTGPWAQPAPMTEPQGSRFICGKGGCTRTPNHGGPCADIGALAAHSEAKPQGGEGQRWEPTEEGGAILAILEALAPIEPSPGWTLAMRTAHKVAEALRVERERADRMEASFVVHADQCVDAEVRIKQLTRELADSERRVKEAVGLLREARKQMDLEENWQDDDFRPKVDAFLAAPVERKGEE